MGNETNFYFEQNGTIYVKNKCDFSAIFIIKIIKTIKWVFYREQIPNRYGGPGQWQNFKPVVWEKVWYHSRSKMCKIHDGISHQITTVFDTILFTIF